MPNKTDKVLIVTGSLISQKESSLTAALGKQLRSFRASSGAWMDIQAKVMIAEMLISQQLHLRSSRFRKAAYRQTVEKFYGQKLNYDVPELTEVLLATLLRREGVAFEVADYCGLYANRRLRTRLLSECKCVFASTTLLRDLSEMAPMMTMLKQPDNTVVAGGALVNMLAQQWPGCPGVDLLASGYGELLVPALAQWIRSGYTALPTPAGGRIEKEKDTVIMHSGLPDQVSLDFLPTPDWQLARDIHGQQLKMVYYESVRGCRYRCLFCNFPFLFEDRRVRSKSAGKIAEDWAGYAAQGVEYINTLDSLFTMPKKRLLELCRLLIKQGTRVKWICYARADDLADQKVCELMRAAGCLQVHIGLESGSQRILDNMNKRCTVAQNRQALTNCRAVGIATITTIIVGFPGEDEQSIRASYQLLRETPPDMYYLAALNTRFERAPILAEKHASRFGLQALRGGRSSIPYWRHDSMACTEVGPWIKWLNRKIAKERISLDGSLFWSGFLSYRPHHRQELLDFQYDVVTGHPLTRQFFSGLDLMIQNRLEADVKRVFGPAQ